MPPLLTLILLSFLAGQLVNCGGYVVDSATTSAMVAPQPQEAFTVQ